MVDHYSDDINESYYLGRKLAVLIGVFMGVVSMFMYVSSVLIFFSLKLGSQYGRNWLHYHASTGFLYS